MSQFQIPQPCQNCLRFHYGHCREAPKQCWRCSGYNHIERYCPHRRRNRWPRNEALPGSRPWCEYHGLYADPLLRSRVCNALKVSPNCNIWIDDEMIYQGSIEHHFKRNEMIGRSLADRMTRRRSRSPMRDGDRVQRGRSRSPIRRRSPSPRNGYSYQQRQPSPRRGRSRSPVQQRRSPPRTPPRPTATRTPPRPRLYSLGFENFGKTTQANATKTGMGIFEFRLPNAPLGADQFKPFQSITAKPQQILQTQGGRQNGENMTSSSVKPLQSLVGRPPLGDISNSQTQNTLQSNTLVQTQGGAASKTTPKDTVPDVEVDDPHFVLGVRKEAQEPEIIEAYQQRMWEVELERVTDPSYIPGAEPEPNNVWDESIQILRAAKKRLVGY